MAFTSLSRILERFGKRTSSPSSDTAQSGRREFKRADNLPDWQALFATNPTLWERLKNRAESGTSVLIASNVGGHGPVVVMESMLAIALTLRGAKVHTLLCDAALPACMRAQYEANVKPTVLVKRELDSKLCAGCYKRGRNVYEQLGLHHHRLSELVTPEEREEAVRVAETLDLAEVKSFVWNGLAIGEHAFAGALRYYARGTLDLRDPETATVVRRYVEAALITAYATTRLVETEKVQHASFHHGIYVPQGIVGEVCRQKNVHVSNWVVAYRRNTLIFSHDNTYHRTLIDEPVDAWSGLQWNETHEQRTLDYLSSRWEGGRDWIYFHEKPDNDFDAFAVEAGLDPSKPMIGMLTNVFWDAQLHFRQNAFNDMREWVVKTIEWFRHRPNLQLIIRIHPAEIRGTVRSRQKLADIIAEEVPDLPANVFVVPPENPISTYAAMLKCDSVIIYGTKMGVELSSIGIPIIVAGEAWIRSKGLTTDANTEAEYYAILERLPAGRRLDDATVRNARKYAFHFFFRRMLPLPFVEPMDAGPNFKVELAGLDDLLPGRQPGLDVICEGIVDQDKPFVYKAETLGLHDAA